VAPHQNSVKSCWSRARGGDQALALSVYEQCPVTPGFQPSRKQHYGGFGPLPTWSFNADSLTYRRPATIIDCRRVVWGFGGYLGSSTLFAWCGCHRPIRPGENVNSRCCSPHTTSPNSIHKFSTSCISKFAGVLTLPDVLNDVVDGHSGGIQRALARYRDGLRVVWHVEEICPSTWLIRSGRP